MNHPHQSGRSRMAVIAGDLRVRKEDRPEALYIANAEVAGGWHVSESDQFEINRSIEGV